MVVNWTLVKWGAIAVAIVLAVGWVTQPIWAARANKAASVAVTQATAKSTVKGAVQAAQKNERVVQNVEKVQARSAQHRARVAASPDPFPEWIRGMCEYELYKGDPQCGPGGGGKREGGGS